MTEFFKGKKIVIPGGGGFFGSHLVPRLVELGAEVFVPRQKDGWDLRNLSDVQRLYGRDSYDMVINLAANQGGIAYHNGKQGDMYYDNTVMSTFLMQEAQKAGIQKYVNVIAGCSYPGYGNHDELNEEDYFNGAVHESIFSYGFPRKASAVQGLALKKQHGFNSIHLVYANMYGPGEHFNPDQSKALAGMLKKFYEAKKEGKPEVEIWGTGKPTRDWLYVKDGVEGLLVAAEKLNDVSPVNIATGVAISIKELAETIKKITGYSGALVYNTEKPDGALKKMFGTKRMQEALQWVPKTTLEQGIQETLAWLEDNYDYAILH